MFLNILTWVVLIALAALVFAVVVILGTLPGKVARKRGHPQVDAINVMSWLGIITLGLLWPFALIWAYVRPAQSLVTSGEAGAAADPDLAASLTARLDSLEEQVRELSASRGRES